MSKIILEWIDGTKYELTNVCKYITLDKLKSYMSLSRGIEQSKIKAWTKDNIPLLNNYERVSGIYLYDSTIIMATEWGEQPAQLLKYFV